MDKIQKIKDKLRATTYFNAGSVRYTQSGLVRAELYNNCLAVKPLKSEISRKLRSNPYTRLLKYRDELFALYRFRYSIHNKQEREENLKKIDFGYKYATRLRNLTKAKDMEHVRLYVALELPAEIWLKFEFIAKDFIKDTDFQDDEPDTICSCLTKPTRDYQEIKRVSLNYNTLLILHNAKENGNKALFYYLKENTNKFYNDCIINYILEHSELLNPEYFSFENASQEVHMPAKELFKLYPNKAFKLELSDGVTLSNLTRPESKRISKNDVLSFYFSDDFLNKYRAIILRDESNIENRYSFIHVPMFFVLQALKDSNLTPNGFRFLLWFLSFYRISKKPKIFHSLRKIFEETGMNIKKGYKKPVELLNKYFEYLYSVNIFYNVAQPLKLTTKEIDFPPTYNGSYIQLQKPRQNPPKKEV